MENDCSARPIIAGHVQFASKIRALNYVLCNGMTSWKKNDLPVDRTDENLSYVRLRWCKDQLGRGGLETEKDFGLVAVEFINEVVYSIQEERNGDCSESHVSNKEAAVNLFDYGRIWLSKLFYVKRFLVLKEDALDHVEEE